LKAAADAAGKPIYLELSSINPVVILPGALESRFDETVQEFCGSCLMGTGQFCTNPGLLLLVGGELTARFLQAVADQFSTAPVGTLLSRSVQQSLQAAIGNLKQAGAELLAGDRSPERAGYCMPNTLLRATATQFLDGGEAFQIEAFGNASLCVVADDVGQMEQVICSLEGNLTGCIYSHSGSQDDEAYQQLAPILRQKVGRLLNDKMPTGVAVSAAMNHGGPYPATGHAGFTAVGIPTSLRRFAVLQCFDAVRPDRLPPALQNKNPNGAMWRQVDGSWTCDDIQDGT
jgi:alpha-ketoglutaric semialdehyde dehydrogenase